ncbi:ABC transporter permease [Streptomyces zhihengii]|uniref:ABC transporter permease n=1 Tax=Streptomyces zhihengii TaxID=1818004 RepID=A0ABS2V1S4_9ACTN|nr:ABC transporter permease [Streptomyces zhihengii]MBM9623633.1 ABC transporter permease [Streptomyces zhihengii]
MLAIALSELIQIFRNRSVLLAGFLIPVVPCAFFVYRHEVFEDLAGLGYIAAVVVCTVGAFGLYTTTVTTLASRRQTLFLKRLRSTPAGDATILLGLMLPVTVLALLQVTVILVVLSAVTGGPAQVPLLVAAIVATVAMMLGLGLATAGLTNSPEHAQVTTLPVSIGTIAVATWVGITGTEELTLLKRLLPGGAATELVVDAWEGGAAVTDSLVLLAPTLAWVVVAAALASRLFRWEPRR